MATAKNPASTIVDVGAQIADINEYWFLGSAAGITAKGFFVTATGRRTGNSFSTTFNAGNGTNDALQLSTSIPADAVGAIVRFSDTVYFDLGTGTTDDFEDNYTNYPQYTATDGNVKIGRVA